MYQWQCPLLTLSGSRLASVGSSQTLGFGRSYTHSAVCQVLHAGSPPGCSIRTPSSIRTDQKARAFKDGNKHKHRAHPHITYAATTNRNQTGGVRWLNNESDPENVTLHDRKYVFFERVPNNAKIPSKNHLDITVIVYHLRASFR